MRGLSVLWLLATVACASAAPPPPPGAPTVTGSVWAKASPSALALLSELIKVDTGPGADTGPAANILADYLQAQNIETQIVPLGSGRAGVWARWRGQSNQQRPILLISHLDTAASSKGDWPEDRGPRSAAIAKDALWGRGARGGKALAATQAVVLATLAKQGLRPNRDVFLFVSPDGIDGNGQSIAVLAAQQLELTQADFALGPGPGVRKVLDSKSLLHFVARAERGQATLDMVATALASEVERDPERAVSRLAHALEVVSASRRKPRLTATTYAMMRGLSQGVHPLLRPLYRWAPLTRLLVLPAAANDEQVGPAVRDTVYAVGVHSRRSAQTRRARAELQARLLPETRPAELRNWVRQRVGLNAVHVTVRQARAASESPDWPALLGAVAGLDELDATWALQPEPTDLAQLRALGVPAYGYSPFAASASTDRARVGRNEHLPLDELERGVERYGKLLQYLLQLKAPQIEEQTAPTPAYK